jgi:ketosteroid isomerase-like protein
MHLRRAHRSSFDKVSLAASSEFRDETVIDPTAHSAGDAGDGDVALSGGARRCVQMCRHGATTKAAGRQDVGMSDQLPEHPNATAYRQTAAAFRAGDMTAIEALIDADVVWHVPGTHHLAGDVIGRDAVAAFLTALGQLGFWLVEHDVFGNDAHVCALSEMGANRPGRTISTRVVSIFHFRDGRQVERWLYPEDMTAWDSIFQAT